MKGIDFNRLSQGARAGAQPVEAVSALCPADSGKVLLDRAGLNSLEAVKNAFLADPGTAAHVELIDDGTKVMLQGDRRGWLVVESCADDHRGTIFETFAGAAAQVWATLSMQDAGTLSVAEGATNPGPFFTFRGSGRLGATRVVMVNAGQGSPPST